MFKEGDLRKHRFGVNYTPSRRWYYCWNDFESDAIARDFDAIAALGMDHLRLMLIWPSFHPNPDWVSPVHLERLDKVMRLAGERNLDVQPAVFTGWLSGYAFKPPFLPREPFYTSEKMWKAQELFVRELVKVLSPHKNFLGFDLGNEINCCWSADTKDGDAWMDRMLSLMESLCPERLHINGVDNGPWFEKGTFSPQAVAARNRIIPLHAYIFFTGALKHSGPLEPPCVNLAAGMAALSRSWGGVPDKPVWVQEFGASDEWVPRKDIPEFMEKTVEAAVNEGVSWFTWWASHDIDRSMAFHSLEYDLGLLTVKNEPKESARMFKALAERYGGKPVRIPSRRLPPPPEKLEHEMVWRWLLDWMGWKK